MSLNNYDECLNATCKANQTTQDMICTNSNQRQHEPNEKSLPCIIVHGGAGDCSDSTIIEKITACKKAASVGYQELLADKNSIDAVEAALLWLESDEFFNCGYGSVLNEIGDVQMDASIMDGEKFTCGSVAAVSDIEHPISLAKYVLKNLPNSIIVGEGAKMLAKCANINWITKGNMVAPASYVAYKLGETDDPEINYDIENLEYVELLRKSLGTVGCVAWDGHSIAAGTTTGGLNRKMVGRIGDSPILGCGTYADKNVGCSLTGHGESIIKLGIARCIADDIEQNHCPRDALKKHFDRMLEKHRQVGGGIVLQTNGCWDAYFTSTRMPYAVIKENRITFGANLNENWTETYHTLYTEDCGCAAFGVNIYLNCIFIL